MDCQLVNVSALRLLGVSPGAHALLRMSHPAFPHNRVRIGLGHNFAFREFALVRWCPAGLSVPAWCVLMLVGTHLCKTM